MEITNIALSQLTELIDLLSVQDGLCIRESDKTGALAELVKRQDSVCLQMHDKDRLVGVAFSGFDGKRAYLYHLWVHPDYRKIGAARDLVHHVMSGLKSHGAVKMHGFVLDHNIIAQDFFASLGFERRDDIVPYSICID